MTETIDKLTKVKLSNLDKILYPKLNATKGQVIEHYIRAAPKMLAIIAGRPLVLTRYPNGVGEDRVTFYAKNAPEGTPSWVKTARIYSETAKRNIDYIVCSDLDTLIWLANLAALEIHMPLSTLKTREFPDFLFFDVDPELPATIEDAVNVSLSIKEKLDAQGLKSYIKTSGKKGLHIVVPIHPKQPYSETRSFVHKIGVGLAKENPIVASEYKDTKKPGKVFVDYLQNSHGRTMVVPYSLRATPVASVSTPLEWREIKKGLNPLEFNIFSVVKRRLDPWNGILNERNKLEI